MPKAKLNNPKTKLCKKVNKIVGRMPKKQAAHEALLFFKNLLFETRPRLKRSVYVDIETKSNLDAYGYCSWEDDNLKPREFTITLRKSLSKYDMIDTIAHEMVHVWQYSTGRLKEYCNGTVTFDGKVYGRDYPYSRCPWEKEAYKLENKLVRKYIEFNQKKESYVWKKDNSKSGRSGKAKRTEARGHS